MASWKRDQRQAEQHALPPSVQRRVDLLEHVLSAISSMINEAYMKAKKRTPPRLFWNSLNIPLFMLEEVDWKIYPGADDEALINRILKALEKLVDEDGSIISKESEHFSFPKLETIRHQAGSGNVTDLDLVEEGFGWTVTMPIDQREREHLKQSLDLLAKLRSVSVEDGQPAPEEGDDQVLVRRPRLSYAPMIRKIFQVIANYCRCSCDSSHKAVLLLATQQSSDCADGHSFSMLLSRKQTKTQLRWRELDILLKNASTRAIPRFQLPSDPAPMAPTAASRITSMCTAIHEQGPKSTSRLDLKIEGTAVFRLSKPNATSEQLQTVQLVSLKQGYLDNQTELASRSRTCIALVLSYALLDFCWEPWFPNGWTNAGITLLHEDDYVRLQPTLVTRMDWHKKPVQAGQMNDDLKLLFHAVLLMEIFEQRCRDPSKRSEEGRNINEYRKQASENFSKVEWGVYELFRSAVDACITGYRHSASIQNDDSESGFVNYFYCTVIQPLEREYRTLWANQDPDHVLAGMKLPYAQPLSSRRVDARLTPKNVPMRAAPLKSPLPRFQMFDAELTTDSRKSKAAEQWLQKYKEALERQPDYVALQGSGVKIGILDTGIDLQNLAFLSRRNQISCWPDEASCVDKDGHGTHVAYLAHLLAPRARLQIAKVCGSQSRGDVDIARIAKAIRAFSSGPHRVDIINMSFGFPGFREGMEPILEAIREARTKGVLLFAAAGNEGGNRPIAWPAELSDVLCVHAADGYGNVAEFNATDERHRRICTLGEALPSCEMDAKQYQKICRSGTSFASPIAAATAAIVLGFVEKIKPSEQAINIDRLKQSLRTKPGMETALCLACVQKDGKRAGYSYVTPRFFLEIEASSRIHILADLLKNCPE